MLGMACDVNAQLEKSLRVVSGRCSAPCQKRGPSAIERQIRRMGGTLLSAGRRLAVSGTSSGKKR